MKVEATGCSDEVSRCGIEDQGPQSVFGVVLGMSVCMAVCVAVGLGLLLGVFAVVPPQGRAAGVTLTHMQEVLLGPRGGEAAVFAHEDLGAALAVGVLLSHAVDLAQVRLQGAALGEGFLTQLTPVRPDTCGPERVTYLERVHVCVLHLSLCTLVCISWNLASKLSWGVCLHLRNVSHAMCVSLYVTLQLFS